MLAITVIENWIYSTIIKKRHQNQIALHKKAQHQNHMFCATKLQCESKSSPLKLFAFFSPGESV